MGEEPAIAAADGRGCRRRLLMGHPNTKASKSTMDNGFLF
jgi:hypothetical protein